MKSKLRGHRETIMKILSVIVAIILWSYVMSEVDPTINRSFQNIPVEYRNLSTLRENNYYITSPKEAYVDVVVRGQRKTVNAMKSNDIVAYVNVGNLVEGSHSIPVQVQLSDTSVSLQQQDPLRITLEVDKVISEEFKVDVETVGELSDGYILESAKLNQDSVSIRGPKRALDSIYKVVAKVNLNSRTETTLVNAKIVAYDENGEEIPSVTLEPNYGEVQLTILKSKNIPIEIVFDEEEVEGFIRDRVEITPNTVNVVGNNEVLSKIQTIQTQMVSKANLMESQTLTVGLEVPEGVRLAESNATYLLRYNRDAKITKEFVLSTKDLYYKNSEEVLSSDVDRDVDQVKIVVSGEKNLIEALNQSDLKLVINPEKRTGEETVKLELQRPNGVEILSMDPSEIQLKW